MPTALIQDLKNHEVLNPNATKYPIYFVKSNKYSTDLRILKHCLKIFFDGIDFTKKSEWNLGRISRDLYNLLKTRIIKGERTEKPNGTSFEKEDDLISLSPLSLGKLWVSFFKLAKLAYLPFLTEENSFAPEPCFYDPPSSFWVLCTQFYLSEFEICRFLTFFQCWYVVGYKKDLFWYLLDTIVNRVSRADKAENSRRWISF